MIVRPYLAFVVTLAQPLSTRPFRTRRHALLAAAFRLTMFEFLVLGQQEFIKRVKEFFDSLGSWAQPIRKDKLVFFDRRAQVRGLQSKPPCWPYFAITGLWCIAFIALYCASICKQSSLVVCKQSSLVVCKQSSLVVCKQSSLVVCKQSSLMVFRAVLRRNPRY